jgi:hypothetical protein
MPSETRIPQTFDEAIQMGGTEISAEEAEAILSRVPGAHVQKNLVNCRLPENDGRYCGGSNCYEHRIVSIFCINRSCARYVVQAC